MGNTQFGNFRDLCRDSTLPICNLFPGYSYADSSRFGSCNIEGISLKNNEHLGNLGAILFCGLAIVVSLFLLWRSERKQAAVGRREMQLFLLGYIIIEVCEIFTVGKFPLNDEARIAFTGIHIGFIVATTWILLLNAVVGYQFFDDGTLVSLIPMVITSLILLIGSGYIALDTGFNWTGYWDKSLTDNNQNIALYVLYQLAPLLFLFLFFVLEAVLVIRVLGERKPMLYLGAAALLFAVGQIFNYIASIHICNGTHARVDGSMFETLFTLLAVVAVWVFWSSITEDDWPMPVTNTYT
ncbi:chitin synthase III catalytic subunit [Calycina marina]|uniref:Chitin synthase III catalytic subunit n=1 Tax=Calycina marina TaxID=1763456 RepID=A0A9P7Z648_9HELO|nr:chitin synthase III catalytic subunit [Calycina marina]